MRLLLVATIWLMLGQSALAQSAPHPAKPAADCANAATQLRMTECAYEDFLAAGAGYAASYDALSRKLEPRQREQLRRTQTAWMAYHTAACKFESSGMDGGSARDMVKWQCTARMMRTRAAELQKLVNCPEGDLSCPRLGR